MSQCHVVNFIKWPIELSEEANLIGAKYKGLIKLVSQITDQVLEIQKVAYDLVSFSWNTVTI